MEVVIIAPSRTAVALAGVTLMALMGPAYGINPVDPARSEQWGLHKIAAPTAWETAAGDGAVVAILDSGVDADHEELRRQVVAGRDMVDDDADPSDELGRGTHVAGVVAAEANNGRGIAGVAPNARIMPVRVVDERGETSLARIEAGLDWASSRGAHVILLSLDLPPGDDLGKALGPALRRAYQRGSLPVMGADNDMVTSNGIDEEPVLVVSATTRGDSRPLYTSGVGQARWALAAPGGAGALAEPANNIITTARGGDGPGGYEYVYGNGIAAAHVAGVAALVASQGHGPLGVVERLLYTAEDIGYSGPDADFGDGRVRADRAVTAELPAGSGSIQGQAGQPGAAQPSRQVVFHPVPYPVPMVTSKGGAPSATVAEAPMATISPRRPSSTLAPTTAADHYAESVQVSAPTPLNGSSGFGVVTLAATVLLLSALAMQATLGPRAVRARAPRPPTRGPAPRRNASSRRPLR